MLTSIIFYHILKNKANMEEAFFRLIKPLEIWYKKATTKN